MHEHVILLHGVWMRGITLWPLARRLRAAGYEVETFDYASVVGGPAKAAARLRERMRGINAEAVHLVGHSLGGLVAMQAVRGVPGLPAGCIVCLGSPLRGSAAARGLLHLPGGRHLLGRSTHMLTAGLEAWDDPHPLGMVAGCLPLGFGRAFSSLSAPHDGTVAVEETRLPGLSAHCTVHASHTGLLLSAEAADRILGFLRSGCFVPDPRRGAHGC